MAQIIFLFFLVWGSLAAGGERQFDTRFHQGTVRFQATSLPGNLLTEANLSSNESKAFQWVFLEKDGALHFVSRLQLEALETGDSERDKYFKESVLETSKYREARLKLEPFFVPLPEKRKLASFQKKKSFFPALVPVEGEIQWRGRNRKMKGQIKVTQMKSETKLQLSFGLKLSDFAISAPSFKGTTLADVINVNADFILPL